MKRAAHFVALLGLACAPAGAHEPADAQPVIIGQDGPDLDACGAIGEVTGLDPRGDNFLAVRVAPTTRASKIDELRPGDNVWICSQSADGEWLGIVFGDWEEPGMDCMVGSPVPSPIPYHGECYAGWVHADYITVIAG